MGTPIDAIQHILSKGYRRARNFGFLHPNSKLIPLVQLRKRIVLPHSNHAWRYAVNVVAWKMKIIRTRINTFTHRLRTHASNRDGHITQHTLPTCRIS